MRTRVAPSSLTRRDITAAVAVACLPLASVWWSARPSLAALGTPERMRVCPMVYPAPASCHPGWHLQVTVIVTLALLALLGGAVVAIRRRKGRSSPVPLAVVALAGLVALAIAAAPTRLLPVW